MCKTTGRKKIKICESESSETVYWLKIIRFLKWLNNNETDWEFKESEELLAIFTSISNKLN
ncbi:MAG: four helix bundle protein [Bacteroidales bacterium]|nr:four helix bundle protein [Bacteroidales bacterium]